MLLSLLILMRNIARWRYAFIFPETPAEVRFIIKANFFCNFLNCVLRFRQVGNSLIDAELIDVIYWGLAGKLLKQSTKMRLRQKALCGNILQANGLVIMILNIGKRRIDHILLAQGVLISGTFLLILIDVLLQACK